MSNFRSDSDQLGAMLRDMVPVYAGYLKNLMEEGFTRGEAFRLVRDYHASFYDGWRQEEIDDKD